MIRTITLLALVACGGAEQVEAPAPEPTEQPEPAVDKNSPEAMAAVADKIAAEPDKADAILKEAGWTAEEFEKALYELAKDPARRAAYAKARKG